MRLSENRIRRIIKEELRREVNRRAIAASERWSERILRYGGRKFLNEGWQGGDVELGSISGKAVARMLNDSGETLLANLIMNHDRPGASEYIWDQVLEKGGKSVRSWKIDFPLEHITYQGMSLHDMGFRNGSIIVTVGLAIGQAPVYDFSPRISGIVKIDVDFIADDRYGERIKLGELRPGGLRASGRRSAPPVDLADVKHSTFSLQDVDLDYLDHLVARREAMSFV